MNSVGSDHLKPITQDKDPDAPIDETKTYIDEDAAIVRSMVSKLSKK